MGHAAAKCKAKKKNRGRGPSNREDAIREIARLVFIFSGVVDDEEARERAEHALRPATKKSASTKKPRSESPGPLLRAGAAAAYRDRNATLRDLGFGTYEDYLASPIWSAIRSRVLARDGYTCFCCRLRATEVHHKSYGRDVLAGQDNSELISICGTCHTKAEIDSDGYFVGPTRATTTMRMMRSTHQNQNQMPEGK